MAASPTSSMQRHTHFAESPTQILPEGSASEKEERHRTPSTSRRKRWTLGILADDKTDEVPGTVLLLSKFSTRNIPLGLEHENQRGRSSTRGSISGEAERRRSLSAQSIQSPVVPKKTPDGQVILDPQPDDSKNDPLNWPAWRRDAALLSLGFYCMIGGGVTPILAAGFNQVAASFDTTHAAVARTTGLYMLGLGIGSVIFSPTAILYGKRPIYLLSSVLFVVSSIWCAAAPDYANLAVARIFQGIAVSPVECLPSATIAEIFFLHERAFRIGVYTLLLLGGKNLVPLVSAAIIQGLGWRWVFWIVAIIVGFGGLMLFLFVPETFWDRTPRPKALTRKSTSKLRRSSTSRNRTFMTAREQQLRKSSNAESTSRSRSPSLADQAVEHADVEERQQSRDGQGLDGAGRKPAGLQLSFSDLAPAQKPGSPSNPSPGVRFAKDDPNLPHLHNLNSPYYTALENNDGYLNFHSARNESQDETLQPIGNNHMQAIPEQPQFYAAVTDPEKQDSSLPSPAASAPNHDGSTPVPALVTRRTGLSYTTGLRQQPPMPWSQTLKPWNGRLNKASWWKAAIRPAILFAYPSVLWSALVYSLSVGWLIVLSESVSEIYANRESYNFTSLQIGLVYLSPFIGGVLGTAVAGKFSDVIVRFMARRNDGVYEPEYRLVMAVPIAITTAIGLMGFGWSAEERDAWIVPTVFFGVISFGCSLGSTTAITFCVDSYRQYAGEALVTLNFSKNVFHGLVWSLFFPQWLEHDGSKDVFVTIGGIQLACMLLTIPMYVFGKRARMWTVRKGMMDKF